MTPWEAVLLGVVQGLTEFLPISSSGHLVVVPWLLGRPDGGLTFDVALHMGTLLALVVYFWREWLGVLMAAPGLLRGRRNQDTRLLGLLVLGTVPAAIAGFVGEEFIERTLRSPYVIAALLAGVGVLFLVAERWPTPMRRLKDVRWTDALFVGCAQALALAPGVSRSGITIVAGLSRGLRRDDAARFSFLLATPAVAGAGVLRLRSLLGSGLPPDEQLTFLLGFLSAAVVGFVAIAWLLDYLRQRSLAPFAYYRFGFAALIVVLAILRSSP